MNRGASRDTIRSSSGSSVLNLLKQRQVCPSLFFQFNMRISVIYDTLSVSCKRVVRVLSPLASNSCGGSHIVIVSESILNVFTVHLNGIWLLIWHLSKPVLGGHPACIKRILQHSPRVSAKYTLGFTVVSVSLVHIAHLLLRLNSRLPRRWNMQIHDTL